MYWRSTRWIASGVVPVLAEQAGLGRDGEGALDDELLQSIAAAGDGPTADLRHLGQLRRPVLRRGRRRSRTVRSLQVDVLCHR